MSQPGLPFSGSDPVKLGQLLGGLKRDVERIDRKTRVRAASSSSVNGQAPTTVLGAAEAIRPRAGALAACTIALAGDDSISGGGSTVLLQGTSAATTVINTETARFDPDPSNNGTMKIGVTDDVGSVYQAVGQVTFEGNATGIREAQITSVAGSAFDWFVVGTTQIQAVNSATIYTVIQVAAVFGHSGSGETEEVGLYAAQTKGSPMNVVGAGYSTWLTVVRLGTYVP